MKNQVRILLAGGGSGGPVSPVLAVAEEIRKLADVQFLFVGTKNGPEKNLVAESNIPFVGIRAAKLRRYFSLMNLVDVFVFFGSLFAAFRILRKFKPDVVFSAGGFVAVPLCWVGKMTRTKVVVHQQDARIGLANKLVVFLADTITTAFEGTSKDFHSGSGLFKKEKVKSPEWVGNPVRKEILKPDLKQIEFFNLHDRLPILLVLGGAAGANQINQLIAELLPQLVKSFQIVHQTGRNKNTINFKNADYHSYELIPFGPYAAIVNSANMVIARAGLSTIAELSATGKISIIIPMPNSHQEENGKILKVLEAAVVMEKEEATPENLIRMIRSVEFNPKWQAKLVNNIQKLMPNNAGARIAKIIVEQLAK